MEKGEIQLILGCMFAEKTSELIRRLNRYEIAGKKCFIIKYAQDVRYSAKDLATHGFQKKPSNLLYQGHLMDILRLEKQQIQLMQSDIIGIDEGQFFPDIAEFADYFANRGKILVIAALDGTFQRKSWDSISPLIPFCEKVKKLRAVCMLCGDAGAFTKRISADQTLEKIGGKEEYQAVCRNCWYKNT